MAAWVGPTVAFSLVVIAIAFAVMAAIVFRVARRADDQTRTLARELAELRGDIGPTIQALNRFAASGEEITGKVKGEIDQVLRTSRRIRRQVIRGVRHAKGRLQELDTLYEVVHDEVQNTALDVAATLRSVRKGSSALTRIRRLIRGRR